MKYIPILFVLVMLSCSERKATTKVSEKVLEHPSSSAQGIDPMVGVSFLNAYITNRNQLKDAVGVVEWVASSPLATDNLKEQLKLMVDGALEKDPELGLGFDPIFDAQDYPDGGMQLIHFNKETGYLKAGGIAWESFTVTLRLVQVNGQTLVDGCGAVDIPYKQSTRQ